jgi:hypothetical protein
MSFYDDWLDYDKLKRLYIIKGTPGNGKSGFMKRIAKRMNGKGFACEYIYCSSDPASLDGVYFPEPGIAFVDGSMPHVIEPKYPLAIDSYLPLTQFADDGALAGEREEIVSLRDSLRGDYARLTRILSAVRSIQDEQSAIVMDGDAVEKIERRALGFIRREIRKGPDGILKKRFLSAFTPDGEKYLWDTVGGMADRIVELRDPYRMSGIFLRPVMNAALAAGQEVCACYDPLVPSVRLKHLILPGLKLAFVSAAYPGEVYRRVRLDAAISEKTVRQCRLRLRFLSKTEAALMLDGYGVLADTARKHRRLEDIYNPHVDFSGVRALADAYCNKLLS